jgi:hypothetical protein
VGALRDPVAGAEPAEPHAQPGHGRRHEPCHAPWPPTITAVRREEIEKEIARRERQRTTSSCRLDISENAMPFSLLQSCLRSYSYGL